MTQNVQTIRPLHALFDLTGQVAIITGGSRGLGLQIAEALGEFGARVVLVARKAAEIDQAVKHLAEMGTTADGISADLGKPDAAEAVIRTALARTGKINILVNNAGATWGAAAEDFPADAWAKVMDLNVTGLFRLTQAAARACFLPAGRGKIVNIASTEGLQGHHPRMPPTVAYNTAKGAVVNLTRALAAEWGPRGINVNAIAPGYFPSRMTRGTLEKMGDHVIDATPRGKLGGDQDLKGAALLLASAAGDHITGQVLVVDGGASII